MNLTPKDLEDVTEHILAGIAAMEGKNPIKMLDNAASDIMIEYLSRIDSTFEDTTLIMQHKSKEPVESVCEASPISALHTIIHWFRGLEKKAEESGKEEQIEAVKLIAIAMYAASKQFVIGITVEDKIKDSKINKLVKNDISPKT
jgi:hypothetical protein